MLPRQNRLRDPKLIQEVFKGKKTKNELFSIWHKESRPPSQIVVMVSKKASRKASKRNKLKRRVHESFSEIMSKVPENIKVVVSANPKAVESSYEDIKNALLITLKK